MKREHTFDILVAGEINPDLILRGDVIPEFGQVEKLVDSADLVVGSSSAIFACAATRLGLKVAFMGVCGDDAFGHFMLDKLIQHGVDISGVIVNPDMQTGLSVILMQTGEGDTAGRAILTYPGAIAALQARQVTQERLQYARHLHIASYFLQLGLQPGLPDLFRRARELGLTTSLDTNWDPSGAWGGFDELLKGVDVFLPNQNEALAISRSDTLDGALDDLSDKCRVVAVKCGREGAQARQGGVIVRVSALPVKVVDTIGAGDTFDAGFLYGWLNHWDLARTLALAAACGSLSTREAGGTAAQPTLEEALKYVSSAG